MGEPVGALDLERLGLIPFGQKSQLGHAMVGVFIVDEDGFQLEGLYPWSVFQEPGFHASRRAEQG